MKSEYEKNRFKIEDYEFIKEIAGGGFAIVSLVQHKTTRKRFAAKTNLIMKGNPTQNKLFVAREISILIRMQHPTIIRFYGFSEVDFAGSPNTTILMDFYEKGSLALVINQAKKSCPPGYNNTKRQIILIGIARAMMLLHQNNIIHRDLKPHNILLDNDYHPHITDFGLSKFFDPFNSVNQSIVDTGTPPYMAPEVIESDHFNTKADVYAFGILMWEILTGQLAYHDVLSSKKMTAFQLKSEVLNGKRPIIPDNINPNLKVMIEKCWSAKPEDRPTFSEIYRKLSLSQDDSFFQFEAIPNVIEVDEGEDDYIIVDGEILGKKQFCLDDVDYNEILNYIETIKPDIKSETIRTLETTIETQSASIVSLRAELEASKKHINKLNAKLNDVETIAKNRHGGIKSETIRALETTIEAQSASIASLQAELTISQKLNEKLNAKLTNAETIAKNQQSDIKSLQENFGLLFNAITEANKSKEAALECSELKGAVQTLSMQLTSQRNDIKHLTEENKALRKLLDQQNGQIMRNFGRSFSTAISLNEPGILFELHKRQKSPFDRLFVISQSGRDIYNLIDPSCKDFFGTLNQIPFFIQFDLEKDIPITGIIIRSDTQNFPKSFNILINGKLVKSITEATQLNGKYKESTIDLPVTLGKSIAFVSTGKNWDRDNCFLFFSRFEILSNDAKYPNGVFSTFVNEAPNHDPHKSRVLISTTNLISTSLHLIDSETIMSVLGIGSWIQIELVQGSAILIGFRLKREEDFQLKSYRIIGTDNEKLPLESWVTLIEVNEKSRDEHKLLDSYMFDRPSPPVRFVRIVNMSLNWAEKTSMKIRHFELFGTYF